jgi:hypothetical protein
MTNGNRRAKNGKRIRLKTCSQTLSCGDNMALQGVEIKPKTICLKRFSIRIGARAKKFQVPSAICPHDFACMSARR